MSNGIHKKTVYIMEDDVDILSLVSHVLRKHNFETIMDFNGNDFDMMKQPCPDLYIIDINLIGKNGGDICIAIKNECPQIPVLIMSAYVNLEKVMAEVNADKYIQKPFEITELVDTVSVLLSKTVDD